MTTSPDTCALLTDTYQLTMLQAYLEEGMSQQAVFELYVRRLPDARNFLVAAGLEQALQFLENLAFTPDDIAWLERQGGFSRRALDHLRSLRFEGDVHAMPEGTVFFADEPILRVSAPLPQAQLVESRLLNLVHFETVVASKAARMVLAAHGRKLVDFGLRRAHGAEAALLAARAAYIAGFDGTATAEAGRRFGIPVFGTMAHSFVQAHASEREAFAAFARARPDHPTLLVDTYDTEAAVRRLVELAPELQRSGIRIGGVRLDSGDLGAQARTARALLDQAGLADVTIFASGNVDEHRIAALLADGAPIDGFGVGTSLATSDDAPALDAVYKLQSYAGTARRKRSPGKATWPGVKQVLRSLGDDGLIERDVIQLEEHVSRASMPSGEALLRPCMRGGRRIAPPASLATIRAHCARQLALLPPSLRLPQCAAQPFRAVISDKIHALAQTLDAQAQG
ncbi:nicotinate phosphoribosyltransferase [Caldimonas sp. KR1-144]|uniref:nicotinate phosphoribosyltransferase n=1 Tax=Caldimonas sp. KR1-144 TaxID=3400911 RepID=UPI003BFB89AC